MITRRILIASLVSVPLAGCLPVTPDDGIIVDVFPVHSQFEGRWVEVLLGSDGEVFDLAQDGTAASIDAPGVTYLSWREDGNILYLTTAEDGEVGYIAYFSDDGALHLGDAGDTFHRVFRAI